MTTRNVILIILALTAGGSSWSNLNCPAPRAPDNGLSFIFRNGELVHFRCHPGYQMRGRPVAHCLNSVWTHSAPECRPVRKGPSQSNSTSERTPPPLPYQWKTEKHRQLFQWGDDSAPVYGDGPRRLPLINGIWPPQVLALGPQSTPKILVKEEIDIAELRHRQLEELQKHRLKADQSTGKRRQGRKKNKRKNSVLIDESAPRETVLSLGATEDGEAFSIALARPNNDTDKVHAKQHHHRHHRGQRKRPLHKKYYAADHSNFVTSRKSRVNTSGISPYHTMYQFNSNAKNDVAELRRRPVEEVKRKGAHFDTSCVESIYRREVPIIAPQVPNAFVYRYETKTNKWHPFNDYMEVNYRCLSGFVFATNAQTLHCKEAAWVGEIPRCVPEKA